MQHHGSKQVTHLIGNRVSVRGHADHRCIDAQAPSGTEFDRFEHRSPQARRRSPLHAQIAAKLTLLTCRSLTDPGIARIKAAVGDAGEQGNGRRTHAAPLGGHRNLTLDFRLVLD